MRTLYIPTRTNPEVLEATVRSLYDQVDAFMIINNLGMDLAEYFKDKDTEHKMSFINPPDPMGCEQSINVAVKYSYYVEKNPDYVMWAHHDIIAQPGAVTKLFEGYEKVKNTRWGVLYGCYDTFCLFNPLFFINENIWGDSWLFPNYFGDNHRYRMMDMRGYSRSDAEGMGELVRHVGSQTIRNSRYFNLINSITFELQRQVYIKIWGGGPGSETINDPTAGGLYPMVEGVNSERV